MEFFHWTTNHNGAGMHLFYTLTTYNNAVVHIFNLIFINKQEEREKRNYLKNKENYLF